MNNDILFYDFNLNLLHILPPFSEDIGYSSVNTTNELNNSGALEFVFCDEELKTIIKNSPDNIIVVWRDFQGFITSYKFTDKENRIFGMSLNGLLHRVVLPPLFKTVDTTDENGNTIQEKQAVSGTVESLARSALSGVSWLSLGSAKGFTNTVSYQTSKYMKADEYIRNLMEIDSAGYKIKLDISNKKFIFECIKPKENSLIISENNLNAYDFETIYNNKNIAYGGWYKEEQPNDADGNPVEAIWKYISTSSKSGIYKIDTVLDAETKTEALNELAAHKSKLEITTKTRNIIHNEDYIIGDIVRVQNGNTTVKRIVSGVNMWNESIYGEQPILSEMEGI